MPSGIIQLNFTIGFLFIYIFSFIAENRKQSFPPVNDVILIDQYF